MLRQANVQDTSNGLRAVRMLAKRLKLDGVYGPLYDLFEVSERFKQAVEVTAGTRCVDCTIHFILNAIELTM